MINKYTRNCPFCNRIVILKNKKTQKRQIRLNRPCKFCTSQSTAKKAKARSKKQWKPIIGRWPIRELTLERIKRFWKTLTQKEKNEIISKTSLQKMYFWGHLKRKNRHLNHKHCRETMSIKYSGENHWMKRPEVLDKVRKSYEKYRGDGHWSRRNKNT
jgi:hypothetical protein